MWLREYFIFGLRIATYRHPTTLLRILPQQQWRPQQQPALPLSLDSSILPFFSHSQPYPLILPLLDATASSSQPYPIILSPLLPSPSQPSHLFPSPSPSPLDSSHLQPWPALPFSLSTPHPHSPGQPLPLKSIPLQPLPAPPSLPRLLHLAALARPSLSLSQLCPLTALASPSLSPP